MKGNGAPRDQGESRNHRKGKGGGGKGRNDKGKGKAPAYDKDPNTFMSFAYSLPQNELPPN